MFDLIVNHCLYRNSAQVLQEQKKQTIISFVPVPVQFFSVIIIPHYNSDVIETYFINTRATAVLPVQPAQTQTQT